MRGVFIVHVCKLHIRHMLDASICSITLVSSENLNTFHARYRVELVRLFVVLVLINSHEQYVMYKHATLNI